MTLRLWIATLIAPPSHMVLPIDPTKAMLRAAAKSMSPGNRPTEDWVSVSVKHRIRYQSMIAAYKGTTK